MTNLFSFLYNRTLNFNLFPMNKLFIAFSMTLCLCLPASMYAQAKAQYANQVFTDSANVGTPSQTQVQGQLTAAKALGDLSYTKVVILDALTKDTVATTYTDDTGEFSARLQYDHRYILTAEKETYFSLRKPFTTTAAKLEMMLTMERKPGYIFDVTVFEGGKLKSAINTIANAKVEIYNNTTRSEELVIEKHPRSTFTYAFQEGNHYTILVRKPGYLNRRIEAYVDIEGCILCFDGMGVEQPDVVPLMHHDNELGFFLGAISLDAIQVGKTFAIEDIYYDFDQSYIRSDAAKELDKLVAFLKDNPGISVELGSHTDARGGDDYNLSLSQRRAQAAVDYIVEKGGIASEKITSQGYGETKLTNHCEDGVACLEMLHQANRRTELTITGVAAEDPLNTKSLKEIIEDPNLYQRVLEEERKQKARQQMQD